MGALDQRLASSSPRHVITKQDILDRAGEWQLRPEVVEKDYVLGWLLSGLGRHPTVQAGWVFRGGTCLKKCYFETYRFSEDLDFTLRPDAPYTPGEILETLKDMSRDVSSDSGITIWDSLLGPWHWARSQVRRWGGRLWWCGSDRQSSMKTTELFAEFLVIQVDASCASLPIRAES